MDEEIARILSFSDAFGPSGMEEPAAAVLIESLKEHWPKHRDSIGNVWFSHGKESGKPTLLLDAHLDEVGFIVQAIRENGMLKFLPLGGFDAKNILSCPVSILTRDGRKISAIVSTTPPHYKSQEEENITFDSLMIDPGTCSRQESMALGIRPGDFVVPDVKCRYDKAEDIFTGKAFDCRIGLAAMVETMLRLEQEELPVDLQAIATVQEEVGERGMQCAIDKIKASAAICFEGCPADDTFMQPDLIQTALKKGPMLRHYDRSMITSVPFMNYVIDQAEKHHIPLQLAVRKGGGTNGGILHTHDIPTVVIGIPVRYAHASIGFCSYRDYRNAVKLACVLARHMSQDVIDSLHHKL